MNQNGQRIENWQFLTLVQCLRIMSAIFCRKLFRLQFKILDIEDARISKLIT